MREATALSVSFPSQPIALTDDPLAAIFRQGAQHLLTQTEIAAWIDTYRRDTTAWSVNATFGRTTYEVVDESGLTIGAHVWDFLILADALPGVEPEPGDVIVADGRRYEVMALGEDTRGWRWSDPYRTTYRIHTREIGADA